MIALIKATFTKIVRFGLAAIAPTVAWRRANDSLGRWQAVAVHTIAMMALLAGFGYLQYTLQLDALVRSSLPIVRLTWLPLVAVLVYAIAWSAWFVARTLRMPAEKPLDGTIGSAWQSSLDRFARAGIDVTRTPLYLILGSPAGGVRDFFAASRVDLSILPSGEEADEPIQVCGNRDAIFVCCRESSLTGNFTRRAAATRKANLESIASTVGGGASRKPAYAWDNHVVAKDSPSQTAAVGSDQQRHGNSAVATVAKPVTPGRSDHETVQRIQDTLTEIETLANSENQPSTKSATILQPRLAKQPMLRLEPTEATQLLDRLDGLCREIADVRQPYCPINGVIIMVPIDATDCVETADHVGMRIERDLLTISHALELSVSAQVIFSDLELTEGGQSFLNRFPETQRHRRLGASLPAPPASEPGAGPAGVDQAVGWICDDLFPPLGYRLMSRDLSDDAHDRVVRHGNHNIHRVVDTMRRRRDGMSRLLRRAITATAGKVRIRGCFVAATGAAGPTKQAFAEGIMPQISDIQNEVQWMKQRRSRDRWQRRAAIAIYITVAITTCATIAYIVT